MLRPKGGCSGDQSQTADGVQICYSDDTHYKLHSDQPPTQWFIGVAFGLVEWLVSSRRGSRLQCADGFRAVWHSCCRYSWFLRITAPIRSLEVDRAMLEVLASTLVDIASYGLFRRWKCLGLMSTTFTTAFWVIDTVVEHRANMARYLVGRRRRMIITDHLLTIHRRGFCQYDAHLPPLSFPVRGLLL